MKVGHEQNDWNEVDEPYLEVFVTSWHQLTSRNVKDKHDLNASCSLWKGNFVIHDELNRVS